MPLFEYRCRACGAEVELLVRSAETPSCPECQSDNLEKLVSGFAVGKRESRPRPCGCGGPEDCIGNRAAAARARGKAPCC